MEQKWNAESMSWSQEMLLSEVEQFMKSRRMPPTRFGREAVGDPRFVFDLREGREPRMATVARVRLYLKRQAGRP